jgi:hypothetical protein
MRYLFTLGDGNGIFRWTFFGEKDTPSDISKCYEELEVSKKQIKDDNPTFNHEDLLRMTNLQIDQGYQELSD